MTAAALVLLFLRAVRVARLARIVRYMETQPIAYPPATTRNVLSTLSRGGQIRRVGYGRYQRIER